MPNYITLDEISSKINVSYETLRKKCYKLGIEPQKITKTKEKQLIKACQDTIDRKNEAKDLISSLGNVKVSKNDEIVNESGSTLEKRLFNAKKDYDNIVKNIIASDYLIEEKGEYIVNGNNGTVSLNPALKGKIELIKQKNALDKTINELEEKLKLSRSTEDEKRSVIGDE